MSSLTFDHIFCFCSASATREAEVASDTGFSVTHERNHPGQGTANRCVVFNENYLEFIFIRDVEEAMANPLALEKRSNWKKTGSSPYGIGLRGEIPPNELENFWLYTPPYWPEGKIFIHKDNEEFPEQPLMFVIPEAKKPIEMFSENPELLQHRSRSTAILSIQLHGPGYHKSALKKIENIELFDSEKPLLKVIVDGNFEPTNFNDFFEIDNNNSLSLNQ